MTAAVPRAASLSAALMAARSHQDATRRDPLDRFVGTAPQVALWRCPSKRRLLRTGNQVGGKTTAAIVEALWWATHRHPYRETPRRAVQIWIVCVTWTQSLAIQAKLWALCPKSSLADDVEYNEETGFGTKSPVVTFRDGSQIWIRTGAQGGLNLAGSTVDLVIYDEPPLKQRTFAEVERRLTRTGGDLILTMTPINAPIGWVRELAERGAIKDLHFRADPSMFILPDGTVLRDKSGRVMDAEWLAEQRTLCLRHEEPIVIDGEWESRSTAQVFAAWDPTRMWIPGLLDSPVGPGDLPVRLLLGIDYGDDRLRTAAVLVAVLTGAEPSQTRCWVLGEYVPDRSTSIDDDADGILLMLSSRGLRWSDLAGAYGDKRYTDAAGRLTKKSNAMLEAAISRKLKMNGRKTSPPVHSAKRGEGAGRGAVDASVRWLHERMLVPGAWLVDASCVRVREGLEQWDGTDRHPRKDVLDGLRYALRYEWGWQRRRATVRRVEMR